LTEAQLAALFDPAAEQRDMVRHYTLSDADLAMIRRCRGDHSRLGYALMLCYLRYPGRHLHANERPPAALAAFVAEQIDVCADGIEDALAPGDIARIGSEWRVAGCRQCRLRALHRWAQGVPRPAACGG